MLKRLLLLLLTGISSALNAQFKNDNILYTTIDIKELCTALEANKGYLLLDVRTKAEFDDTATAASYNLGHLKGAVNISARELSTRIAEISAYKHKPVFIYCSHSQRSRRAGKMLADSGFTKVFNVNGGITSVYYHSLYQSPCFQRLLETKNPYNFISATELCKKLQSDHSPYLLDVRPDSAFRHISMDAKENAYGAFHRTVNIPLQELRSNWQQVPRQREIVITDIYGEDAALAAKLLCEKGYKRVSVLIEGVDRLIQSDEKEVLCKRSMYQAPVSYPILSTTEFARQYQQNKNVVFLDIRSREEYKNAHTDNWRNIGHMVNAINMPADELQQADKIPGADKNSTIIVYSFGNSPEIYAVADGLYKDGYTRVQVLAGGIFNLRWTAGNEKGYAWLKDLVTDIPEQNQ
ncbi:MAG: rhodanese-like domain-containing protein [Bacteroidetes bacterium]|nr:rhodanese-like domain-containing protein [Bacteroidota bacterium]